MSSPSSFTSFFSKYGMRLYIAALIVAAAYKIQTTTAPEAAHSSGLPVGKISFPVGKTLAAGDYIASCVGTSAKVCTPFFITMQGDGNLVVYKGTSPLEAEGTIWASHTHKKGKRSQAYVAEMTTDGLIAIKQNSKTIWSNPVSVYSELTEVLQY